MKDAAKRADLPRSLGARIAEERAMKKELAVAGERARQRLTAAPIGPHRSWPRLNPMR